MSLITWAVQYHGLWWVDWLHFSVKTCEQRSRDGCVANLTYSLHVYCLVLLLKDILHWCLVELYQVIYTVVGILLEILAFKGLDSDHY